MLQAFLADGMACMEQSSKPGIQWWVCTRKFAALFIVFKPAIMIIQHSNPQQSREMAGLDTVPGLALAFEQSRRELAEARAELHKSNELLRHETIERKMAEETLAKAITGLRSLQWRATVTLDHVVNEEYSFRWDMRFANEDVIRLWLPLDFSRGPSMAAAWNYSLQTSDKVGMDTQARDALLTGQPGYAQDIRLVLLGGENICFHEDVAIEQVSSNQWSLAGTCTDITASKRREEQARIIDEHTHLEALAFLDDLTGLNNRRSFQERLEFEFERAIQYQTPLSVIMLDVDQFKNYNDSFGHPAGDKVLKTVARLMYANARSADFSARYGGEEFIIITPCTQEVSLVIAERLRSAIELADWPHRPVTASFGVATINSELTSPRPESLVVAADDALYSSKTSGRNRVTHAHIIDSALSVQRNSFAINAGASAAGDMSFGEDAFHTGGTVRSVDRIVDTGGVLNAGSSALYQTERTGDFAYHIAMLNRGGLYLVRAHFAETQYEQIGERLFDLSINGAAELRDLDILAEAGSEYRALVKDFSVAVKTGSELLIEFTGKTGPATLSALQIEPLTYMDSIAINCGDNTVGSFMSDCYYQEGHIHVQMLAPHNDAAHLCEVDLTYPTAIYRSERYGTFTYAIPDLPAGARCMVALHFCEMHWTQATSRLFNATINNIPVLTNFDILAQTVPFAPLIKRFFATVNEDGNVVIDFISVRDNAMVMALEVHW